MSFPFNRYLCGDPTGTERSHFYLFTVDKPFRVEQELHVNCVNLGHIFLFCFIHNAL